MEDNSMCIGIDIGYGFTKVHSDYKNDSFPTAVSAVSRDREFSYMTPINVNGNDFIVGEDAETYGRVMDTRTSSFVASDPWMAVLTYALNSHSFRNGTIVLGLPPGMYSQQYGQAIRQAMKNAAVHINGMEMQYRINGNVKIIPQGAGIYFSHIKDNPEDAYKNVAVVDCGHETLDFALFSKNKYIESVTGSEQLGISVAIDEIRSEFYKRYHFQIKPMAARTALIKGNDEINHLNKSYPFDIKKCLAGYAMQVSAAIDRFIESLPVTPDVAIVGGGPAEIIKKHIATVHNITAVADPMMANAVGYWYYGTRTSVAEG